jgi:dienelactone hydrolase
MTVLVLAGACLCQTCLGQAPAASVSLVQRTAAFEEFAVSFPSPVQDAVPPNPTVYVHYYVPSAKGPFPAVVILHHWGALHLTPENELARRLLENGIAAAILVLPYHLHRTPPGFRSGKAMISPDVPRMIRSIQQSVEEVAALVEWLRSRPEIDCRRIGLAGISLGAIVGALCVGELDCFDAAALVLGGGDVADILWTSPIMHAIRSGCKRFGYTQASLAQALAPIEPLAHLNRSRAYNVLMVNAEYDFVVPSRDVLALRDALGNPPITWVTSGHYAPSWARSRIDRVVADYFLHEFGMREIWRAVGEIRVTRAKLAAFVDCAPALAVGGAVDIFKPARLPLCADAQLSTGGLSIGMAVETGSHVALGVRRKLLSSDHRFLPYAMIYLVL